MKQQFGLAVGGGGARALCSIGCLEAFEAAKLDFSAFAGTSMGSVVAALAAANYSASEIGEISRGAQLSKFIKLNLRTLNQGFLSLDKLEVFLREYLPRTFDELEKPLAVVATNLDLGEPVVISEGDLVDAIIASCSIPVLFKIKEINGKRVVDGGLKCQIPYQPLLDMGMDQVVAVSSGFVAPKRERYSGLFKIGMRAIDLMGKSQIDFARMHKKVELLEPDVEEKALLDFKHREFFIERGRVCAKEMLDCMSIQTE